MILRIGGPFSFSMEWEDIPSFDPGWDVFCRFTHSTIKMQGYGLGFLIEVTDATMCRESIP